MRGGTPSTTQPIAGPWLSPQVVNLKKLAEAVGGHRWSPSPRSIAGGPQTGQQFGDVLRRIDGDHADHVIAAVDMVNFA